MTVHNVVLGLCVSLAFAMAALILHTLLSLRAEYRYWAREHAEMERRAQEPKR